MASSPSTCSQSFNQTLFEEWRPVIGWESRYSVSGIGRVMHCVMESGKVVNRLLSPRKNRKGYVAVVFYDGGRAYSHTIHSLVAAAFIGPRPEGLEINHKNGIKDDNHPNNLEYVTTKENKRHAMSLGLAKFPRGQNHGNSKFTGDQIAKMKQLLAAGVSDTEVAFLFGTHRVQVGRIKLNKTWAHIPWP